MIEPIRIDFTVACSPDHAFEDWTPRTTLWWPVEHTVSAEPGVEVTFEPHAGGRIYERAPSGDEHEWGRGGHVGAPAPPAVPVAHPA